MNLNESQLRELLDRYLRGTATDDEKKIADAFFASYASEHPDDGTESLSDKKRAILSRINQRIASQQSPPFYLRTWFKAAAAVLIIAASVWIFNTQIPSSPKSQKVAAAAVRTETTKRGEKLILELPDGTKVHVNANSVVSYPVTFSQTREVTLKGEAFFDVTHDPSHPFTVKTGTSSVSVLGTTFNVKAGNANKVQVTLVTGKVNVKSATQEIGIEPGYQAIVNTDDNNIEKHKVNVHDFIGWKDNVLVFRETSLDEAVVILEEWYDAKIEIQSPALKDCKISGEYKNESLENVIRSLEFLLKADAQFKDEKNIRISGKGCKI